MFCKGGVVLLLNTGISKRFAVSYKQGIPKQSGVVRPPTAALQKLRGEAAHRGPADVRALTHSS